MKHNKKKSSFDKAYERFKKGFPKGHPMQNSDGFHVFIKVRDEIIQKQEKLESNNGLITEKEFNREKIAIEESKKEFRKFVDKATKNPSVGSRIAKEVGKRLTTNPFQQIKNIAEDVYRNNKRKEQLASGNDLSKIDPQKEILPSEAMYDPLAQNKNKLNKKQINENKGKFTIKSSNRNSGKSKEKINIKDGKFSSTQND